MFKRVSSKPGIIYLKNVFVTLIKMTLTACSLHGICS